MAELALAALTDGLSDADPCGPDLDLAEDDDYMQLMVTADTILPDQYYVADTKGERKPFHEDLRYKDLDFGPLVADATLMLTRTRDLRLVLLLAKLLILQRNLVDFRTCVEAVAVLLERFWDAVHPRAEGGTLDLRTDTLQRFDEPLIVAAIQNVALFTDKRRDKITFQSHVVQLRRLEAAAAEGEEPTPPAQSDNRSFDIKLLVAARDSMAPTAELLETLKQALARIKGVCKERMEHRAPKIAALPRLVDEIGAFVEAAFREMEAAIVERDPGAARPLPNRPVPPPPDGEEDSGTTEPAPTAPTAPLPAVKTTLADAGAAADALAVATEYFRRSEPSNPGLLLLRQAQGLIGKSFIEAMRMLVPDHVETASVEVGSAPVFTLSLTRLAETPDDAPSSPPAGGDDSVVAASPRDGADMTARPAPTSRAEAVALLEQVGAFYRAAEPSSPIPLLTERARALTGKDFLALLGDLLPKDALPSGKASR